MVVGDRRTQEEKQGITGPDALPAVEKVSDKGFGTVGCRDGGQVGEIQVDVECGVQESGIWVA
ncbi:hypothetical protein ACIBAC_07500 [Streptomyces sp. NPDC051362]|uniref:hypothetical protein n=1 Tax=Streptomyces sp. NPDC051362 TaxID=3365651 RepID=UPI00379AB0F7